VPEKTIWSKANMSDHLVYLFQQSLTSYTIFVFKIRTWCLTIWAHSTYSSSSSAQPLAVLSNNSTWLRTCHYDFLLILFGINRAHSLLFIQLKRPTHRVLKQ